LEAWRSANLKPALRGIDALNLWRVDPARAGHFFSALIVCRFHQGERCLPIFEENKNLKKLKSILRIKNRFKVYRFEIKYMTYSINLR